jgi:hypothetical protein
MNVQPNSAQHISTQARKESNRRVIQRVIPRQSKAIYCDSTGLMTPFPSSNTHIVPRRFAGAQPPPVPPKARKGIVTANNTAGQLISGQLILG